ncbi:hypothetical protein FQZ97_1050520 [compost metagenome]
MPVVELAQVVKTDGQLAFVFVPATLEKLAAQLTVPSRLEGVRMEHQLLHQIRVDGGQLLRQVRQPPGVGHPGQVRQHLVDHRVGDRQGRLQAMLEGGPQLPGVVGHTGADQLLGVHSRSGSMNRLARMVDSPGTCARRGPARHYEIGGRRV